MPRRKSKRRRPSALTLLLAASSWACGLDPDAESDAPSSYEVFDEGDERIVLNHAPALPPGRWMIDPDPRLEVGEVVGEEPYLFQSIAHAHRLPDGRIVVVDAGASEIRAFSPEGIHLYSRGRAGEGPGEFRNVIDVQRLAGDTLVLIEFPGRRQSIFEGDGTFVRAMEAGAGAAPSYFLTQGRRLWLSTTGRGMAPGRHRIRAHVVQGTADGPGTDTIAVLAWGESIVVSDGDGASNVRIPFARRDLVAVDPAGRLITTGAGYEVVIRPFDGEEPIRARIAREPAPVTAADWEHAVAVELAEPGARTRSDDPRLAAMRARAARRRGRALAQAEPPDSMPAFDELRIDRAGRVWAREFLRPGERRALRDWLVFDRNGRWVTTVAIPAELHLLEIGETHVLARWVGEMDVQRVRLYTLRKSL